MPAIQSKLPVPIFIGASVRSPIGKFGGSLTHLSAPELGTLTLKECVKRAGGSPGDFKDATYVFLGHARQAGAGPNPARQASMGAGLPETVPAFTINQACASGMTAIFSGIEKIALKKDTVIFAGGVESMSNTPYLLPNARWGYRLGHAKVLDGMRKDGFFCPLSQLLMGETVEQHIAHAQKISRKEQDTYALQSQIRAEKAWKQGWFLAETFAIPLKDGASFQEDEHRRGNSTLEALSKLPPVFDAKIGTVTAGNSSGITDGAAFVQLTSQKRQSSQAEILDYETVALDPKLMGLGPILAIQNILKRNALKVTDLAAIEINEAFAAQVLACQIHRESDVVAAVQDQLALCFVHETVP